MTDGEVGGQKFAVKSGVTGLSRGKVFGKRKPGVARSLEHAVGGLHPHACPRRT